MVVIVVREILCQGWVSWVDEEEEIILVKVGPSLEPMIQSSRGATSTGHVKKRMINP